VDNSKDADVPLRTQKGAGSKSGRVNATVKEKKPYSASHSNRGREETGVFAITKKGGGVLRISYPQALQHWSETAEIYWKKKIFGFYSFKRLRTKTVNSASHRLRSFKEAGGAGQEKKRWGGRGKKRKKTI